MPKIVSQNNQNQNPSRNTGKKHFEFWDKTRYLILTISTLGLSLTLANSLALNFTIICMNKGDTLFETIKEENASRNSTWKIERIPMFTFVQEAWLFGAVPAGTILGTLTVTLFLHQLGTRITLTLYGQISAFATIATPFAVFYGGFISILVMRFLQGVSMTMSEVGIGSICSNWSPLKQSGVFLSIISTHIQLGPMLLMPTAAEICESPLGWPAVYYLLGATTFLTFAIFFWLFTDSPKSHKNVSAKELMLIDEGKGSTNEELIKKASHIRMLKDPYVWAVLSVQVGFSLGYQIFVIYGPVYLRDVLRMRINYIGFMSALPYFLSAVLKLIAGPLSDKMTFFSEKARVIFFSSISQYTMALCFVALVFLPATEPLLIKICFTAIMMFSGLYTIGVIKSIQLASRQFAYVLFSWRAFASSFTVLLLPLLVEVLAPDETIEQWARVFLVIAIVLSISTTLFNFSAEVEPRPWAKTDENENN